MTSKLEKLRADLKELEDFYENLDEYGVPKDMYESELSVLECYDEYELRIEINVVKIWIKKAEEELEELEKFKARSELVRNILATTTKTEILVSLIVEAEKKQSTT